MDENKILLEKEKKEIAEEVERFKKEGDERKRNIEEEKQLKLDKIRRIREESEQKLEAKRRVDGDGGAPDPILHQKNAEEEKN
jgi:hypothetical protein